MKIGGFLQVLLLVIDGPRWECGSLNLITAYAVRVCLSTRVAPRRGPGVTTGAERIVREICSLRDVTLK